MNGFISYEEKLTKLIEGMVTSDEKHAKWLNTLSYLENCGARKIAACEHPTMVKEEMLKHAAEEFRHALHLKRQMRKITTIKYIDYSLPYLYGGIATLNYLNLLDLHTSRYLKSTLPSSGVKEASYLLVTYAIELRANELYPIYERILRKGKSPVTVKSILLEEEGHLEEMREGLENYPNGLIYADHVCAIESQLCQAWLRSFPEI